MAISNKISVIFLLSAGHSGSTLLDLVLDSHQGIVGVGELSNWPFDPEKQKNILCTCGRQLVDCSFWQNVFADIFYQNNLKIYRKKIDFLLDRECYVYANKKSKRVDLSDYLAVNEQIYRNIVKHSGKKIIFDSSKDVDRASVLLNSQKLDLIFVHLVRDGRGVAYSFKKKYQGILQPILRWGLVNLKIEVLKARFPQRFIFLRYEDFCRAPEQALNKILQRVGLTFEAPMLNFRSISHHQVEGNRLRFLPDSQIRQDTSWQKELPLLDRIVFNLLFGWLNFFYQKLK